MSDDSLLSSPPEPRRIGGGRYELRGELGRGASGEVHLALDLRTGSEVAVKILRKADAEEIFQLKREFRALADVRHPGVARLYDLHIDDTQCFFSMELVRGVNLLHYVANQGNDRAATLISLLPQLVSAIRAVHALGIVHRDIKPENILIERCEDGAPRLVLLDFGLLAPLLPDARDTAALAGLTGTIAYMAPEQLWGRTTTEATDWYALGGVLFHALLGRPPFAGSAVDVATAKSTGAGPALLPGESGRPWLVTMLLDMLANDPAERPNGASIETCVAEACGDLPVDYAVPPRRSGGWNLDTGGSTSSFFGREVELDALRDAFARSHETALTLVRVSGPSGIGKSELLRHFSTRIEDECGAVVLRGRCHPYEAIPRKGLDQVVDDLSRYLQLDDTSCVALGSDEAAALCQLFPVLGRVDALATSAKRAETMDPQLVRQIGMDAFARVLSGIAVQRPLVVWIDDVQWSDDESAAVLGRFLRSGHDARGLVLLSYRPEAEGVSAMLALADEVSPGTLGPKIEVPPLDATAARSFVEELVASARDASPFDVEGVVTEAAGSPFFLAELVRSLRTSNVALASSSETPAATTGTRASIPRVGEVVALRYRSLPSDARAVMDVLSFAGAPLREDTIVTAAGSGGAWQALGELERECLVRSIETPQGRRVQPYHDRIGEGVRAQFDPQRRTALHGNLVEALEQEPETDHELLVFHCTEATQMARAALHAAPAARRAADTLAFDRAADLYRFALEHGLERNELRVGLAETLANAGRGEEAALAFEQAADGHPADANLAAAIDLRRRSAEQLLRCGRIDEGIVRMREVLAFFGERLPATSGEAMRSFLWQRLRLFVRGTKIRPGVRVLDESSAARLDAMWSTTIAVSMIDVSLAGAVQVRHFHDALDFADPDRLSLALAHEATWRSCFGPRMRRSAADALNEARRFAGQHGHSYPEAWTAMADGIVRWQSARFAEAVPCFDTALDGYRHGCKGVFFEIALTAMYQFAALALAGRIGRLAEVVEAEAEGARRRRDRFALHSCLMGEAVHARLAADEPERALADADTAIAEWPRQVFLMPHYQHLLSTVQADLYCGDAESAWTRLDRAWKPLTKAGYLWLECPSLGLTFLRARAALGRISRNPDVATRAAMLQVASAAERRIRRSRLPLAAGFAATIRAGVRHAAGDIRGAETEVRAARAAFQLADMRMHAAACDWTLTRFTTPAPAEPDGGYAQQWAREEGWQKLDRLADSVVSLPRA